MTEIAPEKVEFGPFTVEEVRECFQAFDLDDNDFVGAGELRRVTVYFFEKHFFFTGHKVAARGLENTDQWAGIEIFKEIDLYQCCVLSPLRKFAVETK